MLRDLRHGVRMLLQAKGWTAVVVVSLALGIGANTALFSAINGLLLKKLPVKDPDTLVRLRYAGVEPSYPAAHTSLSPAKATPSRILLPVAPTLGLGTMLHWAPSQRMISVWLDWAPRRSKIPADDSELPTFTIRTPLELLAVLEQIEQRYQRE